MHKLRFMELWEVLDAFDDRVLQHRLYPLCKFVVWMWPSDDPFTLRADAARDFMYRMEHPEEFPLTPEQQAFWKDALKVYRKLMPEDKDEHTTPQDCYQCHKPVGPNGVILCDECMEPVKDRLPKRTP